MLVISAGSLILKIFKNPEVIRKSKNSAKLVQTRNAGSDDYQHTKEGSKGKEGRKRMLVLFFDFENVQKPRNQRL
jgi:hypothetical protein